MRNAWEEARKPSGIWQQEIRALRAATEMWIGQNRDLAARRITERLGDQFILQRT